MHRYIVLSLMALALTAALCLPAGGVGREVDEADAAPTTGPAAGRGPGPRIVGRVVDERGKPLAEVLVEARAASMGRLLRWAFKPGTRTDANGRFELALPFADLPYSLTVTRMGYYPEPVKAIPENTQGLALTLRRLRRPHEMRGTVVDPAGRPVADAPVELIGEYGLRAAGRTDRAGRFILSGISPYIGQGVLRIRAGGLVAPFRLVRSKDTGLKITLTRPGHLAGTVEEEGSRKPVAGATVLLGPTFASDFRMQATTGADGQFDLPGIPPGKYKVSAVAATHFQRPPPGRAGELPDVTIAARVAGVRVVTAVGIKMRRAATVRGRVLDPKGRPVHGAVVGLRSTLLGDYRDPNRCWVRTDRRGRFTIRTDRFDPRQPLAAFSSRHGFARAALPKLSAGKVLDGVTLKLPGAARVKGVVTDPKGRPIKDVVCVIEHYGTVSAGTDAAGRFDLGRISCAPGSRPGIWIQFRAPRPRRGKDYYMTYSFDSRYYAVKARGSAPQFFLHQGRTLDLTPDAEVSLRVALKPTQLLELTGSVVDGGGRPLPDVKVYLFTGDATADNWLETLAPSGRLGIRISTVLSMERTGKDGRWRFWTVRQDGLPGLMGEPGDWKRYCVGIRTPGGNDLLVRDVVFPAGKTRHELTIRLADRQDAAPGLVDALLHGNGKGPDRAFAALRELTGRPLKTPDDVLAWWWQFPLAAPALKKADLDAARMKALWEELAGEVTLKAYEAAVALAGGGDAAVNFVAGRLEPISVQPGQIKTLVAKLDDDKYAVRRSTQEQLARIGSLARPALRAGLAADSSPEARQRIKQLLAACARPHPALPEARRVARAIRVLELIGTPQAVKLLRKLAKGTPKTHTTEQAKAALRRLDGAEPAR